MERDQETSIFASIHLDQLSTRCARPPQRHYLRFYGTGASTQTVLVFQLS